ncbi:MAG TPA: hypothetical protein VF980_06215 [Thermoanaerobaculia bacterium]
MLKRHASAAALFIALSIAMTWPLAPRLTHAVADPIDPFINAWILDWDHYATFHEPLSLFDANVFYPMHDSLALSENLYGIALLLVPFRLFGASPVVAYNLAMLGGFAFSGFAAYLLGFRLTGSWIAGVAAGVFHAFVPFRFTHVTHVQHVFAGWVPLLVVALLEYIDRPSWRTGLLFGGVFLMNGLTNIHWLLFGSFAVAATALLFVAAGVRRWRELVWSTCLAGVLLLPFLIPYWRVANVLGLSRSAAETKMFSAKWSDWLVAGYRSRVYVALRDGRVNPECWLFPGVLSIVAAVVALMLVRRSARGVTLGILWTILGVFGSLGLNFYFHDFLFDAVPGFRAIRVPARWAEIAYVGLAMLIAVTTAYVARRQRWIAAVIPLLFVVELRAAPVIWFRAPIETPDVYRWLGHENVRAVVELPIDIAGSDYTYAFRSIVHHRNLVNGASGAAPPQYIRFSAMSKSSPVPDEFVDELRRIGCDLVIVHADLFPPHESIRDWLRRETARGRLSFVRRFATTGAGGDWVFSTRRQPTTDNRQLQDFLNGRPTPTPWTFGWLDPPNVGKQGNAFFTGYALSPYGVRGVDLLFDDGRVRIPAILIADVRVARAFPFYGASTPKPRFVSSLQHRPEGVPPESDVQAEIIDGRGARTRLQFYWIAGW